MTSTAITGRFEGKTAVVTGAGSGIGKSIAERLIAEGAIVVATDISAERLDALVTAVASERLRTVSGDVAASETIAAILEAADGVVDALANNAGIMDAFVPTAEITDEQWDRVMSVNLTAPMRLTRAVLPGMIERGHGTIVNTASEAGIRAGASGTAYTASKHAVIGLTKSTAFFYGPKGVRTNAVAPGAVNTNIEAPFNSAWAGERLGPIMGTTVPAPAEPEELAAAITWLLSDDSSNVNGAILMSDGGWSTI
ncbi:NAD(P)-dependent dehydrogenase (short-subunit alcohol dehydrogenase family) [Microbacterium endophyticum]|uniref:NAD(P)-dependent dehydrogenase (Short-subunit alcohol dehydrogenase family) n=1 Tax=Microbacterium endophyticum TaxID=1526412 RepID=A0A7W4YLD5_9MICO|nr:SDR family NAD(P)-dependent oxidoreductase [Microbacterium endophyticum]MBB2975325.1 NAD(P)-dependent dehydrogenase (short-subunit alcohol dehydrogenase family) [Microbacterium endophyticum]NIK35656.1 NAD(P)-dependent dehydrogenase (short-subunit alcohol dehydrogenase family) [Microbacterium endophyticum]